MKKITLLFLSLTVGTVGLFAQKTPVVATVDIQRVLNDYNAFQAAYETLKVSMAPVEEEVKRMQEDAQDCAAAKAELQAAQNDDAFNLALQKVRILCDT